LPVHRWSSTGTVASSLPDALPISLREILGERAVPGLQAESPIDGSEVEYLVYEHDDADAMLDATKRAITNALRAGFRKQDIELVDRKSTRLNSSHVKISYAVFCLK